MTPLLFDFAGATAFDSRQMTLSLSETHCHDVQCHCFATAIDAFYCGEGLGAKVFDSVGFTLFN